MAVRTVGTEGCISQRLSWCHDKHCCRSGI